MLEPDQIFKVNVTGDAKDYGFTSRKPALTWARRMSSMGLDTRVANVYVKDGSGWEHIAQFRNGIKIF